MEVENENDATIVLEKWNSMFPGSTTAAEKPVNHDLKDSLLIKQSDNPFAGTKISEEIDSGYGIPK